ncbi:cytochrome c [Wenxinia marina]|uniref:Cytochrome c, mono-and diheme variant n=1 Tax=Wenxinia marina DSM 24838 TaxID=1123501 RepID=A0A0D0P7U4_9RHOB|nr:cytochrome c [Wenxinia marina]KIQ67641.1 Cytochrome c, mono- and diheme variant [Wenxinia marina DSM 24838]GGL80050.1 diheme cytochrome c-type [Wenxinia marina]
MRLLGGVLVLAVAVAAGGWVLSAPDPLPAETLADLEGDAERGARIFHAAGCAGCHTAPDAEAAEAPVLVGGQRFASPFGTFVAPNISQDPEAGIGDWTDAEIANAVMRGISPEGAHYYPAFPYTTYIRAEPQDVVDLIAHLRTLPADATPSQPHEVGFPFNIRRGIGLWKLMYLSDDWIVPGLEGQAAEGQYLVEALGHCGECHTPRGPFGQLDTGRWLGGAPHPAGDGTIPNITPGGLSWSENDIAAYLDSGFTPEFDSAGGEMAEVIRNVSQLPDEDLAAIAAYVKAVPAVE